MVLHARGEDIKALINLIWLTVSNALDKSIDTATVRSGGQSWLELCVIWCARGEVLLWSICLSGIRARWGLVEER